MNLLNRVMSYDKTKVNQENCNCEECVGINDVSEKKEIIGNFRFADDFLRKIENYRMMHKEKEFLTIINLKYWYKDKKTKKFIWKALRIHGDKYEYSNVHYINNTTEIKIFCKNCKKFFKQEPRIHFRGVDCPKCRKKNRPMTTERFVYEAKQIGTNSIDYNYDNSIYVDRYTKIEIYCNRCKKPFTQRYDAHLAGQGCPNCLSERTLNSRIENFLQESKKLFNDLYDYRYIKEDYMDNDTVVRIICNSCGKTFKIKPRVHISGSGCSYCNMSKGEVKIMIYLENNNIEFVRQFKFENCKNKQELPFDFYIPQYNLCIEFDGQQHFKKINFSNHYTNEELTERLLDVQVHDKIKTDYCKNNGINLLRIRYDENVEEKLTEYFQEHKI